MPATIARNNLEKHLDASIEKNENQHFYVDYLEKGSRAVKNQLGKIHTYYVKILFWTTNQDNEMHLAALLNETSSKWIQEKLITSPVHAPKISVDVQRSNLAIPEK